MAKKYTMHVISGTHWDREWRHTAEQSKPRLIELIDSMVDTLEKHPEYKSYCLDGGQVVLEDYLSIKPENKELLRKYIKAGRIQLVNWYTLPDTFTVAPEALIRNIKLGKEMAKEFGGAMISGYTGTSYGQTSQLPQIYNGFGITTAMFYRGTNKYTLEPLFAWEGADGSVLRTVRTFDEVTRTNWFFYVHQPLVLGKDARDLGHTYERKTVPVHMCDEQLYERAFRLTKEFPSFNKDPKALKKALDTILEQAGPYAIANNILALNMEDNDVPFALLPDIIKAMNEVSPDVELRQSTLDEYFDKVIKDRGPNLPVHKGELRYPAVEHGFNGLLGSVHSSRIKIKILNEQAETGLLYQAEPLSAMAAMLGSEYPKAFLDRAWRHLMLNHAHDSICGAAVDQAHEDMLYNFSIARMVGQEITAQGATRLFAKMDLTDFKGTDHTVTFFNTLPYARKQIALIVVDMPKQVASEDVVDPCTGIGKGGDNQVKYFDVVDKNGAVIPYVIFGKEDIQIGIERELDTKGIKMSAVRWRVLVEIEVLAMGYATYAVRPRGPRYIANQDRLPDRPLMARPNGVLENEHIKVTINPNGTFDLAHKATGRILANQHYFTDNGEVGNAHLSIMPIRNPIQTSLGSTAKITMIESNLLRGIYRIDLSIIIPAEATQDGKDRFREERVIPITTWLTLEKSSSILKIRTRLNNQARDHRLRVNFPSYVKTNNVTVESAFAVERRDIRWIDTGDNMESFYAFQPMQNFVDLSDGKVGFAVLNKGLREYEVCDDADRTIAITLLRTQRAYMTANTMMTPDEFDKYTGLHSFGTLEYEYALYPHTGDWIGGKVLHAAYSHKVPMNAIQGVPDKGGNLPSTASLVTISPPDKLMVSAFKQADDGNGMILRIWNITDENVPAVIRTILPVKSVSRVKLDETTVLDEFAVTSGTIALGIGPHKIETLYFKK